MTKRRYSWMLRLVASAQVLCLCLAQGSAGRPARAAVAPQPLAGFADLQGSVSLPPVHPRNLYHLRMHGAPHHMGPGMPQKIAVPRYRIMQASELHWHRFLRVRAVPIPPPAEDQADFSLTTPAGTIELDVNESGGAVDPQGNFDIKVPPYQYGYYILADADKVHLRYRLAEPIAANALRTAIKVDIKSTLIADVAVLLGDKARTRSNAELEQQLQAGLASHTARLAAKLQDKLRKRDWEEQARSLLAESQLTRQPSAPPPVRRSPAAGPARSATSAATRLASTYGTADAPVYTLMSSSEMPAGYTTVSFGAHPGEELRRQYRTSDGVRFYPIQPTMKVGPFTLTPPWLAGKVTESAAATGSHGAYVTVDPGAKGGGVTIYFRRHPLVTVKSIGFCVQNGTTSADTASAFARRNFKVTAYDSSSVEIMHYNWYTDQKTGGGGFYGLTSDTAIDHLAIQATTGDPFTIDELMYSSSYASSLEAQLGWRSTGSWTMTSVARVATPTFNHYDRFDTGYSGNCGQGSSGTTGEAYSMDNYWQVGYGGSSTAPAESVLTGPGFTLSNLVLDYDDATSTDAWLVGANATDTLVVPSGSTTATELAACEIPSGSCHSPPWSVWASTYGITSATMMTHWSHVHWQAYLDVEKAYTHDNGGYTYRYVEYSTDNGTTWRNAYWWGDDFHHGTNGNWCYTHLHPYESSYMNGDANGDGVITNTDFTKGAGTAYNYDNDRDGTGAILDADDVREWDTEFYQDYAAPDVTDADGDGIPDIDTDKDGLLETDIEGTTIAYRFRFYTTGTPSPADATTCSATCAGWKIDDVSFNNDDPAVGYYTDFNNSDDPNQP